MVKFNGKMCEGLWATSVPLFQIETSTKPIGPRTWAESTEILSTWNSNQLANQLQVFHIQILSKIIYDHLIGWSNSYIGYWRQSVRLLNTNVKDKSCILVPMML